MKTPLLLLFAASFASAQSPPEQASITVAGKTIRIDYSAPSVRGRKIFGDGGLLSQDPTYPAWRAGAKSRRSLPARASARGPTWRPLPMRALAPHATHYNSTSGFRKLCLTTRRK